MSRFLLNMIVAGAQVALRGFITAYQKVVASGGRTIEQGEQTAQKAASVSLFSAFKRKKIDIAEAHMILGTKPTDTPEVVEQKYQHLFTSNDPATGGSFYIQSKIYRAKEAIDIQMKADAEAAKAAAGQKPNDGK